MSAALIVAIASALASAQGAINHQLATTIGAADVRIKPASPAAAVDAALLERVRGWPEVREAQLRVQTTLAVSFRLDVMVPGSEDRFIAGTRVVSSTVLANSLGPTVDGSGAGDRARPRRVRETETALIPPPDLLFGRLPTAVDEIVIDALLAQRLSHAYATGSRKRDGFGPLVRVEPWLGSPRAPLPTGAVSPREAERINAERGVRVGDEIEVVRQLVRQLDLPLSGLLSRRTSLRVVGIAAQPPLGGRPQAYMTLEGLERLVREQRGSALVQIDAALRPEADAAAVVAERAREMPRGALLQTTEKITSGLDQNVESSRLGMILAMVMGAISGGFIIMTGLTTAATERQRELAILRCVGATRGQLARVQVLTGLLLGVLGAAVGVPLGVGIAWGMSELLSTQLPTGLVVEWSSLVLGAGCALLAGLLGAAWPAWQCASVSPLAALGARASAARPRGVVLCGVLGLMGLAAQGLIVGLPRDGQVVFWGYATAGLPLMFTGYFLLGVPAVVAMSWVSAGVISRVLRLPPRLLHRTIVATPYRHGLTAGALMGGLALMVALWTNGGAIMRDWLGKIEFPDAFVSGLSLGEQTQDQLRGMTDIVASTAAVSLLPVETDVFGVRALQRYTTTFVGFDAEPFFAMTRLTWVQGDPKTALERLQRGGAVIVAREFLTARGLGVGHRFRCTHQGRTHEFEIVGVVSSPGLELVSKFFNVGEDVTDQSLHAVFGSRADMREKFFGGGPAPIQLIQIQLTEAGRADDEAALERIRRELLGAGILDAGSGRFVKEQITTFARGGLLVMSTIAAAGMLIASLGVANIVIAGIESRRFEFGVLRAIGAPRWLLSRLVLGEAVVMALTACVLGTLLGLQGAWAGHKLHGLLLGLNYEIRLPMGAIAAAWGVLGVLTMLAALPAVVRLHRRQPRELLAAMKG